VKAGVTRGVVEGEEVKVVLQVKVRAAILAVVERPKGVGGEVVPGLETEVPQRKQRSEVRINK